METYSRTLRTYAPLRNLSSIKFYIYIFPVRVSDKIYISYILFPLHSHNERRHKYIKERIDDMVKLIIHGDDADIIPSCGKNLRVVEKNCALRENNLRGAQL